MQEQFGHGIGLGQHQTATSRRYSDQDIKTRNARASLLSSARKHKSTASYPIYSPVAFPQKLEYSSNPPSLPWGATTKMAAPRQYARPGSAGSTTTSRSSFESRHKSPLSVSSSVGYESSRTSQDSTFSNEEYSQERSPASVWMAGKRNHSEQIVQVPSYSRYVAGGESIRPLMIPERLSSRGLQSPTSPKTSNDFAPSPPGEGFRRLPEEILLVVLAELRKSHLHPGSLSCSTCYMRDLTSLSLSCRKWWGAARIALYEDVQLVGNDSVLQTKKKFKMKYGTRLKLLRRTLRANTDLAGYVKVLKVPAMPEVAKHTKDQDKYMDQVASVIMACPNLERLPGFHSTYNYEFSRFVCALSSRTKLLERVWMITENPFQRQHRYKASDDSDFLTPIAAPNALSSEQSLEFLALHSNWSHLQTLVLHSDHNGTIDSHIFLNILKRLPSLENLHVSSFPEPSFNDVTLLLLPALKSLRLDSLPGISENGLSHFASAPWTNSLKRLSLISLQLLSLPVLARLFSHLKGLTHLTICQAPSLSLTPGVDIFLHPYLASSTLQYLHWEFTNPDPDTATDVLSKSISFSGFPALKVIRAPTDTEGSLQKLCRPRARVELPGDRYRNMDAQLQNGLPLSQSMPVMPYASVSRPSSAGKGQSAASYVKSPTRSAFSLDMEKNSRNSSESNGQEKGTSVSIARMLAQRRIDAAVSQPQFHIIVWDTEGQFLERLAVGGFIGNMGSKIHYSLKPDVDGMDEAVCGIEGPGGLLNRGEEMNMRDGCTGSWNLEAGERSKGKGKDRWWHTERGRWREMPLERLF